MEPAFRFRNSVSDCGACSSKMMSNKILEQVRTDIMNEQYCDLTRILVHFKKCLDLNANTTQELMRGYGSVLHDLKGKDSSWIRSRSGMHIFALQCAGARLGNSGKLTIRMSRPMKDWNSLPYLRCACGSR
jgi:hypothetical protein